MGKKPCMYVRKRTRQGGRAWHTEFMLNRYDTKSIFYSTQSKQVNMCCCKLIKLIHLESGDSSAKSWKVLTLNCCSLCFCGWPCSPHFWCWLENQEIGPEEITRQRVHANSLMWSFLAWPRYRSGPWWRRPMFLFLGMYHRLYIKMDNTSPLPPTVQEWSQNSDVCWSVHFFYKNYLKWQKPSLGKMYLTCTLIF